MSQSRLRLGQEDLLSKGRQEVEAYDFLLGRVSMIADDTARGDILKWVGRSDMPGSPAERYKVVADGVARSETEDGFFGDRVEQLRGIVTELGARVDNAERAYGTLLAPAGAGSTPEAGTAGLCLAGGIALLGLVVVPLLLE